MPDTPIGKVHPHPFKAPARAASASAQTTDTPSPIAFAELCCTSNYTFLTGASHPEEFVIQAAHLGYTAIGIADVNTLAGVVRAYIAGKDHNVRVVIGSRLVFTSPAGLVLNVYPDSREGYAHLCKLLTLGKRRAPKGECHLALHDLAEHARGLLAILRPPPEIASINESLLDAFRGVRALFPDDRLSLAAACLLDGQDDLRLHQLHALATELAIPLIATTDAHYHHPDRRPLQDVLTCIRHGCTIDEAGYRLHANAERCLKPPHELARLFADYPQAIRRSVEVARRALAFSMDHLKYQYPSETCPPGFSPSEHLRALALQGAAVRYAGAIPEKILKQIDYELALIAELKYEPYFLTCHDIVRFARSKGILCQGRGGAANSAVCFVLGITEVDPNQFSLLFERFISRERNEPPDIDIDFEHERREEVIQYIYAKYGRERAALTAEVISYRGRSAVRDVGKAMGLSLDTVDALARHIDHWGDSATIDRVREAGLNPRDPTIARVIALSRELLGFPRHLSQHVGGFVITQSPLCELVPIENAAMEDRTVIEWDKDDIDAMGMLKVDVLGLGMLTAVRWALTLINRWIDREHVGCDDPPPHIRYTDVARSLADESVYDMVCKADTVGVFQIESRAQMSMLPRLRPRSFYDLVIEVAIVRPGPIQGKMVHPYLKRRNKEEEPYYPTKDIETVLGRTLGVPLFQEQAMQLSIVAAGFTPDEADKLRRAMAAWKRKGDLIFRFGQRIIEGMIRKGYTQEFAERCFEQIKGFSEYGFPESHAASFAILVYVSAWLKRYHPAAFTAALINSQPMGFYAPAQLIRDAKEHGVLVREADVNFSAWDCSLEPFSAISSPHDAPVLRLGLRMVRSLPRADADKLLSARLIHGPFTSIEQLWRSSAISVRALRALARADAFRSMGLSRQSALWAVSRLSDEPLPLFDQSSDWADEAAEAEGRDQLPPVAPDVSVLHDYDATGVSLKAHPVSFVRDELLTRGAIHAADLRSEKLCPSGRKIKVAGLVLVRQRPATASGVVFMTLEDETGIANLVIWPKTFERQRSVARLTTMMLVSGRVERAGEVVHVHVSRFESLDEHLPRLRSVSRDFH